MIKQKVLLLGIPGDLVHDHFKSKSDIDCAFKKVEQIAKSDEDFLNLYHTLTDNFTGIWPLLWRVLSLLKKKTKISEFSNFDIHLQGISSIHVLKNLQEQLNIYKEQYDNILFLIDHKAAYFLCHDVWKVFEQNGIKIIIDQSFEASYIYEFSILSAWIKETFSDRSFVNLIVSGYDIEQNEIIHTKKFISESTGINVISYDFFRFYELKNYYGIKSSPHKVDHIGYTQNLNFQEHFKNIKKYDYLFMNRRNKDHRLALLLFLEKKSLIDNGLISANFDLDNNYSHRYTVEQISQYLGLGENIYEHMDSLNNLLPMHLPGDKRSETEPGWPQHDRFINLEWFENTKFSIVAETFFHGILNALTRHFLFKFNDFEKYIVNKYNPGENWKQYDAVNELGFITEKTYKTILFAHPFIISGPPQLLKQLRNNGFETYPELFDESYDTELDPVLRMNKIGENIEYICKNGFDIDSVKEKCVYNREHFLKIEGLSTELDKLLKQLL